MWFSVTLKMFGCGRCLAAAVAGNRAKAADYDGACS
jgi:hypothetical protein